MNGSTNCKILHKHCLNLLLSLSLKCKWTLENKHQRTLWLLETNGLFFQKNRGRIHSLSEAQEWEQF